MSTLVYECRVDQLRKTPEEEEGTHADQLSPLA